MKILQSEINVRKAYFKIDSNGVLITVFKHFSLKNQG